MNGEHSQLFRRELDFVGFYEPRTTEHGWRQPSTLQASVSADAAMLQASMSIGGRGPRP
jgi:hypothetical protein